MMPVASVTVTDYAFRQVCTGAHWVNSLISGGTEQSQCESRSPLTVTAL